MRSRIAAQLQGKLGFKNENLTAFGITPRKRVIRRRPTTKPPVDPTDPVTPADPVKQAEPPAEAK